MLLPTEDDGYTPPELVDIYKFMTSTISGSSIKDYYKSLGYRSGDGPKRLLYDDDGNPIYRPHEYETRAPFYLSQLLLPKKKLSIMVLD